MRGRFMSVALLMLVASASLPVAVADEPWDTIDELREDSQCDQDKSARGCVHPQVAAGVDCSGGHTLTDAYFDYVADNYFKQDHGPFGVFGSWSYSAPAGGDSGTFDQDDMIAQIGGTGGPSGGLQYYHSVQVPSDITLYEGQSASFSASLGVTYSGTIPSQFDGHASFGLTVSCKDGKVVIDTIQDLIQI